MSKHTLPRDFGQYRIGQLCDLPSFHNSEELDDWFDHLHRCMNCGKVVKTHEQLYLCINDSTNSPESDNT